MSSPTSELPVVVVGPSGEVDVAVAKFAYRAVRDALLGIERELCRLLHDPVNRAALAQLCDEDDRITLGWIEAEAHDLREVCVAADPVNPELRRLRRESLRKMN